MTSRRLGCEWASVVSTVKKISKNPATSSFKTSPRKERQIAISKKTCMRHVEGFSRNGSLKPAGLEEVHVVGFATQAYILFKVFKDLLHVLEKGPQYHAR